MLSLVKLQEKTRWGMYWIRNKRLNKWTIINNAPFFFPDLVSVDGKGFKPVFFVPFGKIEIKGKKLVFLFLGILTTIVTEENNGKSNMF